MSDLVTETHVLGSLPNETLGEIFVAYTRSLAAETQTSDATPAEKARQWLNFTHVCSRWRQIALRTPEVWSYPDLSLPARLLSDILPRTRNHALVVKAWRPDHSAKAVYTVRNHLSQILELDLTDLRGNECYYVLRLATPSAPLLERLTVKVAGDSGAPKSLFPDGFHAPRLRHLTLGNCGRSISQIFPALSNFLSIRILDGAICSQHLGQIFESSPNLQLLELVLSRFIKNNDVVVPAEAIPLPRLQSFSLSVPGLALAAEICRAFSFPASISFFCHNTFNGIVIEPEDFHKSLTSIISQTVFRPRFLELHIWSPGSHLSYWLDVMVKGHHPDRAPIDNESEESRIKLPGLPTDFIVPLLTTLPLLDLEGLTLKGLSTSSTKDVFPFIQHLPKLHTLSLSDADVPLVQSLQKEDSAAFPALKNLYQQPTQAAFRTRSRAKYGRK